MIVIANGVSNQKQDCVETGYYYQSEGGLVFITSKDSIYGVVVPGKIYLSSKSFAMDVVLLEKYGIKNVISVLERHPEYPNIDGVTFHYIYVEDFENFNMKTVFESTFKKIEASLAHGPVLIHCMAGVSRSSSVAIYYMMKKGYAKSYEEALSYLRNTRPQVQPNSGFERQLKEEMFL